MSAIFTFSVSPDCLCHGQQRAYQACTERQCWNVLIREGYKRISKTFDVPWNSVEAIINMWRKWCITKNQTSFQNWGKEKEENLSGRLTRDLQLHQLSSKNIWQVLNAPCMLYDNSFLYPLHVWDLTQADPFLWHKKTHLSQSKLSQAIKKNLLWSDKTKVKLFWHHPKNIIFGAKRRHQMNTVPMVKHGGGIHHAMELLLIISDWVSSQDKGKLWVAPNKQCNLFCTKSDL